jgi:hypothetical protein
MDDTLRPFAFIGSCDQFRYIWFTGPYSNDNDFHVASVDICATDGYTHTTFFTFLGAGDGQFKPPIMDIFESIGKLRLFYFFPVTDLRCNQLEPEADQFHSIIIT